MFRRIFRVINKVRVFETKQEIRNYKTGITVSTETGAKMYVSRFE